MGDPLAIVTILAFFGVTVLIVRACDAVAEDSIDNEPESDHQPDPVVPA
jgi:hypothetical protein